MPTTCTATVPPTSCPRVPPLLSFTPKRSRVSRERRARFDSLSPPAFQPIHFAPRTQTRPQVSFSRRPTASNPISKFPFVAPLFSWSYELLFPQTIYYQKHLRCPPGVPPNRFSEAQLRRLADHARLSSSLSINCALLFSLAALFRTPIICFQHLADSLAKTGGVGYPPYAQLSLCALCVLCGASAFPALSFPSFGGPTNADAR